MKKLMMTMMTMAMFACGTAAWAYEYPYLTLQTADGTATSVAVDDLVLTMADGQLVATNNDGTQTFNLSDLSTMYFSDSAQSDVVTAITAATATDDAAAAVEVYTVGGVRVGRFGSVAEAKGSLKTGVYVMKTNDRTFKTTIR